MEAHDPARISLGRVAAWLSILCGVLSWLSTCCLVIYMAGVILWLSLQPGLAAMGVVLAGLGLWLLPSGERRLAWTGLGISAVPALVWTVLIVGGAGAWLRGHLGL